MCYSVSQENCQKDEIVENFDLGCTLGCTNMFILYYDFCMIWNSMQIMGGIFSVYTYTTKFLPTV